MLPELTSVHTN